MFVRRKKLPGDRVKVQVVKSVRSGGKVRQRVLRHVGTATSAAQLEQLEGLARLVIEEMRDADGSRTALFSPKEFVDLLEQSRRAARDPAPFGTDLADCREESRVVVGVREAFGAIYDLLGWDRLFGARRASANRIVKELVLARIARPLSKRATVRELDAHGELALNLDYVYRSMDMLDDGRIKAIRRRSLEVAKTLLPEPLTAVFYDTTSLYFESERDDALRIKGYSKDGKPHRVQVVFALLVTPEGLPVGYEVFPGNTYEGSTLVTALEALERDHAGVRFTVVADAGMISKDNEAALQARGTPYILGARLKSRPAAQKRRILDPDGYGPWGRDEFSRSVGSFLCIEDGGRRLVVTHSPKRAPEGRPRTGAPDREAARQAGGRRHPGLAEQPRRRPVPRLPRREGAPQRGEGGRGGPLGRASGDRGLGLRPGRPARPRHPVPQAGRDRGLLPREQARPQDPAGLPLEGAQGAGAHRHLLHGLLLPPARAPPAGGPRGPDEPGPDPAGAERPADRHPARCQAVADVRPAKRGVVRRAKNLPHAGAEVEPGAVRLRATGAEEADLTGRPARIAAPGAPKCSALSRKRTQ